MVKQPELRILTLDIEWKPTKAYVWGAWQENITPEKIIEHGGLLCVGVKWLGEKEIEVFSEWEHGHEEMLLLTYERISEADVVVGYNHDKFDMRKLEGEFVLHGLPPLPPVTTIDCLKAVKKFGFFMNRLAFIAPFLGVGKKMEHEGMALWVKVIDGDEDARKRMARYCSQDVRVTEKLFAKIRPYIRNLPYLGKTGSGNCPSCGSSKYQHRGTVRTRYFEKQRLRCSNTGCGHWFYGKQSRI